MEENLNIESSAIEEVATPQNEEIETTENEVVETEQIEAPEGEGVEDVEVADPQPEEVNNVQQQTAEENARFARLRREAEQKGMDKAIAALGLEYEGNKITTYEQYQEALKLQQLAEEAQRQGIDPKFYTDFAQMQEKLNAYEKEKSFISQEKELKEDKTRSEIYESFKDEIGDISNSYGVDLRTAFTLYVEQNLDKILENKIKNVQNETIKKINQNKNSSPGALNSTVEQKNADIWSMSSNDFEEMKRRALNGEL